METLFTDALHSVSQALQTPVIILLLLLIVVSLVCLGSILFECVTERRKLRKVMPEVLTLMENKKLTTDELTQEIKGSKILNRHKGELLQILGSKNDSEETLATIAQGLLNKETLGYQRTVELTDIVAKLGPMLGLMGTLIPLRPGIVALGNGDTATLSASLLVAFDTTVAGLVSAGIASVISTVRRRWYRDYTTMLEAMMEGTLEAIRFDKEQAEKTEVKR
ncbi:MAG: MotA/TolQ/ExbB proton channel family protein [Clostridiales bacterium]|nr:MotA/TolQ/ExbB proton channel family protein [Clostridiales bacterium]